MSAFANFAASRERLRRSRQARCSARRRAATCGRPGGVESRRLLLWGDPHQISCTGGFSVTPRAPFGHHGVRLLVLVMARGRALPHLGHQIDSPSRAYKFQVPSFKFQV
jgi:hypothetical protein